MVSSTTSFLLLLCFVGLSSAAFDNCTKNRDGRSQACYTCLGRDYENCMTGLTCCKGSCYKLIDIKHELIVKGCTEVKEEDASMKVRELAVPLYWADDERIKGESYFCQGNAFCNDKSQLSLLTSMLVLVVKTLFF